MFSQIKIGSPAIFFDATVSTVNSSISTSHPCRLSRWIEVTRYVARGQIPACSRNGFLSLSDWILVDIGISGFDSEPKAPGPFWMA